MLLAIKVPHLVRPCRSDMLRPFAMMAWFDVCGWPFINQCVRRATAVVTYWGCRFESISLLIGSSTIVTEGLPNHCTFGSPVYRAMLNAVYWIPMLWHCYVSCCCNPYGWLINSLHKLMVSKSVAGWGERSPQSSEYAYLTQPGCHILYWYAVCPYRSSTCLVLGPNPTPNPNQY